MLSPFFESFLKSLEPAIITELFMWGILFSLGGALFVRCTGKGKSSLAESVPTLLTSLGILGTFIGIVVGLLDFDTTNIDSSIGNLLAGLKTAFVTSVVGMGSSVLFKIVDEFAPVKKEAVDASEKGVEDLYAAMMEQVAAIKKMEEGMDAQVEGIKSLRTCIAGDGDDSLTTQIKLLRADHNDGAKDTKKLLTSIEDKAEKRQEILRQQQDRFATFRIELQDSLQKVGEMLSKSATEQVVEALKNVIQDFNNQLTEQFGQNFKELNQAVFKLVEWQENYKRQLEEMTLVYAASVESISKTEVSVAHISEKSGIIPENMDKLKSVMEVNQHQLAELERHLDAFREMRDKAVEAVPQMHNHLDEAIKTVEESVKNASAHYEKMLSEAQDFQKKHSDASEDLYKSFIDKTNTGLENIGKSLSQSTESLNKELSTGITEFKEQAQSINESVASSSVGLSNASNTLNDTSEKIKNHLEDTVKDLHTHFRKMVEEVQEQATLLTKTLIDANNDLAKNTRQIQTDTVAGITQMQNRLESSLEEVFQSQTREVQRTFHALEDQVKNTVGLTKEAVDDQLKLIDQSMQNELARVMQSMGNGLGAIAKQFTKDYQDLVQEMHKVTRGHR